MKAKNYSLMEKSVVRVGLVTAGVLLIPLIGMQVSRDWNWDTSDFVIMGTLIFSTGLIIELIRKKTQNNTRQILIIAGVLLVFLYIWAELAVGIFTNLGS